MNKPIFIHIPKTCGKSIQISLSDEIRVVGHHLPASEVKQLVDDWDSSFKFSVVRNPWDRMVSSYFFGVKKRDKLTKDKDFNEWVKIRPTVAGRTTQCDFLLKDGKEIVDFIARFENIEEDFKKICSKINVKTELPHDNKTDHKHYSHYYSQETKETISELYRDEIEYFGYKYEGGTS